MKALRATIEVHNEEYVMDLMRKMGTQSVSVAINYHLTTNRLGHVGMVPVETIPPAPTQIDLDNADDWG